MTTLLACLEVSLGKMVYSTMGVDFGHPAQATKSYLALHVIHTIVHWRRLLFFSAATRTADPIEDGASLAVGACDSFPRFTLVRGSLHFVVTSSAIAAHAVNEVGLLLAVRTSPSWHLSQDLKYRNKNESSRKDATQIRFGWVSQHSNKRSRISQSVGQKEIRKNCFIPVV